jgi:methylglutaconyl-CoA hydratase
MSEPGVMRVDHGPVAVLTLNRPERRNALSRGLIDALADALRKTAAERRIRAIVLTGAGPTFCSGMDLKEAAATIDSAEAEKQAVADVRSIADLIQQVHAIPKPTITALNGDAYAGGAGLAAATDFVVAESHARIGYPEVKRGLVAAIVMHDLVRQIGTRRTRSLLLTGDAITAEEAERWGLVHRVVDSGASVAAAIELGKSLAASGPVALATTKRLLDEVSGFPISLQGAAAITAAVRVSDEAEEGIRSFLEKRPADWSATESRP